MHYTMLYCFLHVILIRLNPICWKIQVEELLQRKFAREAAEKELQEVVRLLKAAKAMPLGAKPPKSSWIVEEKIRHIIESLESYAIDACKNDEQQKTAGAVTFLT